jgi:hypothetical protein
MTEIRNATLEISAIAGHQGQRRVRVTYDLHTPKDDKVLRQYVTETVVLHGVSCHDAPVEPTTEPLYRVQAVYPAIEGAVHRAIDQRVQRTDLDVEQDWWSNAQDGAVVAIAEWVDHVVAEIQIVCNGQIQAEAATPIISGSWGAVGKD